MMVLILLLAMIVLSLVIAFLVVGIFRRPIRTILSRILGTDLYRAWYRYIAFAVYVVSVAGGVSTYRLEDYADGISRNQLIIEVYKTVIGALSNIAWMLLFFFVATMVVMAVLKVLAAHK